MMVDGGVVGPASAAAGPGMPGPGGGDDGFFGPGMPGPDMGFIGGAFGVIFGLAVVIVIAVTVFVIVVAARKRRVLRDAGIDPYTVDAAIAAKVLRSDALSSSGSAGHAPRSVEQRLAELDDLRARGVISEDEHREARAAILKG